MNLVFQINVFDEFVFGRKGGGGSEGGLWFCHVITVCTFWCKSFRDQLAYCFVPACADRFSLCIHFKVRLGYRLEQRDRNIGLMNSPEVISRYY